MFYEPRELNENRTRTAEINNKIWLKNSAVFNESMSEGRERCQVGSCNGKGAESGNLEMGS